MTKPENNHTYTTMYINKESEEFFMDKAIDRLEQTAKKLERLEMKIRMYFAFAFFSGLVIGQISKLWI